MRVALAAALFVLALTPGFVAAESGRAETALHAGATSLEIGVDTFGDSFGSTGEIAARRHFSPAWAVRLAASVGTSDNHADEVNLQNGVLYDGSSDSDQTIWAVAAQAVWFPVRHDDVALLLALGPKYSKGHATRHDLESSAGQVSAAAYESESKAHSIGVGLDLGFEWFVSRRIALHARTGTTYAHTERQDGNLRTYFDSSGMIIDQFGFASESTSNSFDTVEFGLRIVGYF